MTTATQNEKPELTATTLSNAQVARSILSQSGWIPLCQIGGGEHWVNGPHRAILVYDGKPDDAAINSLKYCRLVPLGKTLRSRIVAVPIGEDNRRSTANTCSPAGYKLCPREDIK